MQDKVKGWHPRDEREWRVPNRPLFGVRKRGEIRNAHIEAGLISPYRGLPADELERLGFLAAAEAVRGDEQAQYLS